MSSHSSMQDYLVMNKLGNLQMINKFKGSGAFSDVFKIKRKTDS